MTMKQTDGKTKGQPSLFLGRTEEKLIIVRHAVLVIVFASILIQSRSDPLYEKNEALVSRTANFPIARQAHYPWAMAIMKNRIPMCTFSLITTKTTLGAAHCIYGIDVFYLHGIIGDTQLNRGEVVYFSYAIMHENFNRMENLNDIGLLILEQSIQLSDRIKTISLPRTHSVYYGKATVVGWGTTNEVSRETPGILRAVKVDIVDRDDCRDFFVSPLEKESYICTTTEDKQAYWDSGTALIYGGEYGRMVIGIYHEDQDTVKGGNSVFTSTGYFADWITEHATGKITFIS